MSFAGLPTRNIFAAVCGNPKTNLKEDFRQSPQLVGTRAPGQSPGWSGRLLRNLMPRPAKTIRQHLLQGTVPQGKPEKPSVYQGGKPKFPSHLSPVARREAKRIVRVLLERGTCTEGDFAA